MIVYNDFKGGVLRIPISKSYAHRYIFLIAIYFIQAIHRNNKYKNTIDIDIGNGRIGQDIKSTLNIVQSLGIKYRFYEKGITTRICFSPSVKEILALKSTDKVYILNVGESGTTLRFLLALVLVLNINCTIDGLNSLKKRPISEFIDILISNGIAHDYSGELPISIYKRNENTINKNIFIKGSESSQLLSGLLLSLPILTTSTNIIIKNELQSLDYVKMTKKALLDFAPNFNLNLDFKFEKNNEILISPYVLDPIATTFKIEADFSSAAFFIACGVLSKQVILNNLAQNSLQGDKKIIDILNSCGANIYFDDANRLIINPSNLTSIEVDIKNIPDLMPILAVIFSFAKGISKFKNVHRLAYKESDRIISTVEMINSIGGNAIYDILNDSIIIRPVEHFKTGRVKSYNDHRIAMASSIAALKSDFFVEIDDSECIDKSYIKFYKDFEKLGGRTQKI